MSHDQQAKGEVSLQIIAIFPVFLSRQNNFKYNSFEVMPLHITISREKGINDKSPLMFVLATRHHTDVIKEFGDFLSELMLAADKVLIVGDFNIHVDNEKDAFGSTFIDILNSIRLDNTCQDLLIFEIILYI